MTRAELLASSSAIVLASLLAHTGADRVALAGAELGARARAERERELLLAAVRPAALEHVSPELEELAARAERDALEELARFEERAEREEPAL